MHIPKGFPGFDNKTILLVLAHRDGKAYTGIDKDIEHLEDLKTSATQYQYTDKEGQQGNSAPGTDHHNKEHYDRVFLNYIHDKITEYENKKMFEELIVFCPADMKKILEEKVPKHILANTEIFVGNFVNNDLMDLVKKMHPGLA